jgi:hypothetical protein
MALDKGAGRGGKNASAGGRRNYLEREKDRLVDFLEI